MPAPLPGKLGFGINKIKGELAFQGAEFFDQDNTYVFNEDRQWSVHGLLVGFCFHCMKALLADNLM